MIQLDQDIMNIQSVTSTNFEAKFQFANTKAKPPTLLDACCRETFSPCSKTFKRCIKCFAGIGLLGEIIARIVHIRNSIKDPS